MTPCRLLASAVTALCTTILFAGLAGCAPASEELEDVGDETTGAAITRDERVGRVLLEELASKAPATSPVRSWDLVVVENTRTDEQYVVAMAFDGVGPERRAVVEIVMKDDGDGVELSFRNPDGGPAFADRTSEERAQLLASLGPDAEALQQAIKSDARKCKAGKLVESSLYALATVFGAAVALGGCANVIVTLGASTPACLGGLGVTGYSGRLSRDALRRDCSTTRE